MLQPKPTRFERIAALLIGEEWMTVPEVEEIFGLERGTLWRHDAFWVSNDRTPRVTVRAQTLLEWVTKHKPEFIEEMNAAMALHSIRKERR